MATVNKVLNFLKTGISRSKNSYDVLIIGGGHNGLVAASYLQKNGLQVCVLERRSVLGGAAVTEEIVPGFKFSRASYVLSLLRPQIYKELELQKHGLKVYLRDPSSYTPLRQQFWQNNARSLTLGRNTAKNTKQISQFSKKDAAKYVEYEEYLQRLVATIDPLFDLSPYRVNHFLNTGLFEKLKVLSTDKDVRKTVLKLLGLKRDWPKLYEFITAPTIKILNQWFESEPLVATLATDAVIGTMASPHSPGSGYVLLHHVMGGLEGIPGAWGYPEGGMGSVTKALASCASSYGAVIQTNKERSRTV